ncbi:MAG TPA: AAA family ATPase, partial [Gemmatimonadaceae bacterium]|nr:AAA family ATPase [Gemmatimonadaceae bacterium]
MIVRLRALGECAIEIGVRRLGPDAERAFAVLLLLVLAGGRPLSRRWVLDLLWPGAPDELRRHNLRQTFYKLRQYGVTLDGDRQSIVLAADGVLSDLDVLLGAAAESDETLLDEQAPFGVFLAGYVPQFSPPFAAWLDEQRDLAHGRLRRALLAVLLDRRRRGAWHDVERMARRVLVLDPLNEEATLALAEATALAGSKSAAIGILDTYVAELGVAGADIRLPATVLRRRIAERLQLPPSLAAGEACFVGRRNTMALLHQQLQSAKSASGRACLLWGDTGMGKSRALSEFGKLAVLEGARVEVVGCHSRDEHHPLSVFMDLVPPLLALPGAIGCSPETLGYLRRLTEHDPAVDTPSPDTGEAELLFARVRQALFDLIDAVTGECCVVLGIEDVHWLDNVSWQVLEELMGWCASRRLLVVLTARDPRVLAGPPRRRTDGLLVHRLPALHDAEALTLLSAVLGGDVSAMSRAFRDWCVHLAEGNPFFLRALAVHWLETGEMHVPTSLRVLVDERVDRLDAHALRALQACAVLGKNSTLERLAAVLEHRRYELLKSLSALEEQGLLASDGPRVPAKHELVAHAALSRLPDAARHLLHRLAAQTLEDEIKGAQAAALLWDCARHWQEAGEAGRALDLVRWCATRLVEVGLPGDAAEALEQGL